jgi:hypothetical protein
MKRDMDLVRKILLVLEEHPHGFAPQHLAIEGFTEDQIGYHIYLMGQANLLTVSKTTTLADTSPQAIPLSITWQGHEFLANAKEEGRWLQAKSIVKAAGEGSFQVWQSVLTSLVTKSVGL